MKVTPIGINIDRENIVNSFYKTYQDRQCAKICKETNFQTGFISYEDGVFLPTGTYVLIKEIGKQDILGRIFHFKKSINEDSMLPNGTAIVNIYYDMNSSTERHKMKDDMIICFINKNHLLNNHNKQKYLQVVCCDITEDNCWKFVRVEYGNPDTKMYYTYGWQYYDGSIYEKMNVESNKLNCLYHIHKVFFVYEENYDVNKETNVEHKIKPRVLFVPEEIEYIIIYIVLMIACSLFYIRFVLWLLLTIWFFVVRKIMRNRYNG